MINNKINNIGLLVLFCMSCSSIRNKNMIKNKSGSLLETIDKTIKFSNNNLLLKTIDTTLDFLNNDYKYEEFQIDEPIENYLNPNNINISSNSKKLINNLGDKGFIRKLEHPGNFNFFKQNDIITDEKDQELYAEKFHIFVSRDVKSNSNNTLILGCGRGLPGRAESRGSDYCEEHLHERQDTIDIDPVANPDIIADLSKDGFVGYFKMINKKYKFIKPEGLCPPIYYKLVKYIREILSNDGKFVISREYAFRIFLSKLAEEFNIKEFIEDNFDDIDINVTKSIRNLIPKIKNKYNNLATNLSSILTEWKDEIDSIKLKIPLKYISGSKQNVIKIFLELLFKDFLINNLEDLLVNNSKLYLGIPIMYNIDDNFNYDKSKAQILKILKAILLSTNKRT